jgi:hypothetical protein
MMEKKHYQKPAMREIILSQTPHIICNSEPQDPQDPHPGTYIPSLTSNEDMNQLA